MKLKLNYYFCALTNFEMTHSFQKTFNNQVFNYFLCKSTPIKAETWHFNVII